METLKNKKHKKRKTRRCLDELRRKTHQTDDVRRIFKNTDAKVCKNKSNCFKNNYITNNRLTLLNKAIRSETVTRVQLAELESKNLNLKKYRETVTSNFGNDSHIERNNNGTVLRKEEHVIINSSEIENPSPNTSDVTICEDVVTPKSIPLFSPGSESKEISAKSNIPLEMSLSSSSSNLTLNTGEPDPDIFDQIIDGIELYLEQKYPHIIKSMDEEMEKTKAELVSCFATGMTSYSNKTSDSNSSTHYSSAEGQYSSPNVPIIQSSVDYMAYSQFQRSAESKTSGIQVSSPSGSSTSVSIHISSPSPLVATVYDTPEYHYYPHKLN